MSFYNYFIPVLQDHNRCLKSQVIEGGPIRSYTGHLLITPTDASNPWWIAFEEAITKSGGKLAKPEVLRSTTDARFARQLGIPTLGFSPMTNTPILLHEHNEVSMIKLRSCKAKISKKNIVLKLKSTSLFFCSSYKIMCFFKEFKYTLMSSVR